jgi:hypothetical protein
MSRSLINHPTNPQQQQQHQQVVAAAMIRREPHNQVKGHCILRLVQFGDHLSKFRVSSKSIDMYLLRAAHHLDAQSLNQHDDLTYWSGFVETFFSPRGVLHHSVWVSDEGCGKPYQITYPALARYFNTHFESGVSNIQMIIGQVKEKELPHNCCYVESQKSSFIYRFENGSQVCLSEPGDAFQTLTIELSCFL